MRNRRSRRGRPADEARMWRADELGGLEVLWASYGHLVFTPHAHEEYLIAVTEGGVGGPIYRGETHEVGPGDVLVLNPEEPHAGGPLTGSPWQYRALYPSAELILQVESEFTGGPQQAPAFAEGVVRDREAARRLRRFHAVAADERSTSLQREALLVGALVWLVGRHSTRRPSLRSSRSEHRGAQRAREYLEEHAVENVSLAELARVAVLSPYYLCRVFRRELGMTPHTFQMQTRVRCARRLLRLGTPIPMAAAEAGFYDQAHLHRHFKRMVGVTPGEYARGMAD